MITVQPYFKAERCNFNGPEISFEMQQKFHKKVNEQ